MICHRNHNVLKHEHSASLDTISRTKSLGTSGRGFSLIEATIALAVIGIMLTSIFALQQTTLQASLGGAEKAERIILLKNVLYSPSIMRENHDEELKKEQQVKEPKTNIKISQEKPPQDSLKKYPIEQIKAQAEWERWPNSMQESLTTILFTLPKKEVS